MRQENKAEKVISSCKTLDQLKVAKRYVKLINPSEYFYRLLEKQRIKILDGQIIKSEVVEI